VKRTTFLAAQCADRKTLLEDCQRDVGDHLLRRSSLFGEDVHDLAIAIEDSFAITFTSDELLTTTTIDQLFDLVVSKLNHDNQNSCLSGATFYRLRAALTRVCAVPRGQIHPNTKLDILMPRKLRRVQWDSLRSSLDWVLPDLTFASRVLVTTLPTLYLASGCILWLNWGAIHSYLRGFAFLGSVLVPLLLFVILLKIARPFAVVFPERCETIRDLVNLASSRNFAKISGDSGWNKNEAWFALRKLVADAAGLPPGLVRRELRFPEDLNIY
jgi:hypothetical protein